MKIAITGHTDGLGKALSAKLSQDNEIIGLSRANGYPLSNYTKIVKFIEDCDILINNAYDNYYQCNLLSEVFSMWRYENKKIISIGSAIIDYTRAEKELDSDPWAYRDHKLALRKLFRHLLSLERTCQLLLVNPGPIDTKMTSHLVCKKLHVDTAADLVISIMNQPLIKEVNFNAE